MERTLTVQERRESDIVFLKMMKILTDRQKDPAKLVTMLKTTMNVAQQKVHNQWRLPMKMVLAINPQIKVSKNWLVSFIDNLLMQKIKIEI